MGSRRSSPLAWLSGIAPETRRRWRSTAPRFSGSKVTTLRRSSDQTILEGPDAHQALESIALQTGEFYQSNELTTDGANPVFAPDGRRFAFETGSSNILATGNGRRTGHPYQDHRSARHGRRDPARR